MNRSLTTKLHIWTEGIALLVVLCSAVSCSRVPESTSPDTPASQSETSVAKMLSEGEQCIALVEAAASRREYREMLDNYVKLRTNYINVAALIDQQRVADTELDSALDMLREWEGFIARLRQTIQQLNEPPGPPASSVVDNGSAASTIGPDDLAELEQHLQPTGEENENHWTQDEARLDKAMDRVERVRDSRRSVGP